jgi:hypothetical protein
VNVVVVARPTGAIDVSQDMVLNKNPVSANVSRLAAGKSHPITVPLAFPRGLAAGTYDIIARLDPTDLLTESDKTNNDIALGITLTVADPFVELAIATSPGQTLPVKPVLSNGKNSATLKIAITNTGNRTLDKGEPINLSVVAHRLGDSQDFPVEVFNNISLPKLKPGHTVHLSLKAVLPLGLADGDYALVTTMDTTVPGDNAGNNTASTSDVVPGGMVVRRGFIDLSAAVSSTTLPASIVAGSGIHGQVTARVTNVGSVALPAVLHVTLTAALRPAGAPDNSTDLPIGSLANLNVARLGATNSRAFRIPVDLTAVELGNYHLVITVTPDESLPEDSAQNNEATGPALAAVSLTLNGDFENGDIGFTSGYTFAAADPPNLGGHYTVDTNPFNFNTGADSFADHTTGAGKMLLVDGSTTAGVVVWQQTINVIPNTLYEWDAFGISWGNVNGSDPSPANLVFQINGLQVGSTLTLSAQIGVWQKFSGAFNSGANSSIILSIRDSNTDFLGNDFALDDISVTR